MNKQTITKKQSILKILFKESTLFHVIAIIILVVGAIFLDYGIAVWETKTFGVDNNFGYICNIACRMALNAMGAFVAWGILRLLFNLLRSGIAQLVALIHYCYLPLTEDEVRGRFASIESYIRYMENK